MRIKCDCGNDTFHINFKPPFNIEAECTKCSKAQPIGGE